MSSVVISGDTSGSITLSAPAVSGTNTATLPAATGTVMVSGNMPAFSAYANTPQSVTSATTTLVNFGTEEYDTNNNFASNRFTPTVAGYYQVNAAMNANSTWTRAIINIWKNGANYKTCSDIPTTVNTIEGNALVYLNGTTDYIEIYAYITGVSPSIYGGASAANAAYTYFQACLVRGA